VTWLGRHIISIEDFSREEILEILAVAERLHRQPQPELMANRLMANLFFEPSTRTRLSFEAAMSSLGGRVIGFDTAASTSAKKGESLPDTIRMVEQYADVVVMRHPRDGSARLASEVSSIPVINGGDGSNQHPTQTFLDLYTISSLFPDRLTGDGTPLRVTFAGDLRYGRTVHSLVNALSHFNIEITTVPAPGLELPEHHVQRTTARGIQLTTMESLEQAIPSSDILYMTRLQEERFPDPMEFQHVRANYQLTAEMLRPAPDQLRILHPLPRVNEIAQDVDGTPHAHYFAQAGNGIPVRQGLLAMVLGRITP